MSQSFKSHLRRPRPEWVRPTGLRAVLDAWESSGRIANHLSLNAVLPAQSARCVALPAHLAPPVREALAARGIDALFSHQSEALGLARQGRSFVVATPTASGKSLCYNLPVLEALSNDSMARALYLFPTKALSRDQEEALRRLMTDAALAVGAITFDGDTPADARRAARTRGGVILTNPDMLHTGIMPHHTNWARLFANLKYIVIDELHIYRGVFGSHLANVLRRLRRIARFHGSDPVFIFASATIGNPREHACRMLGSEVELIGASGAPSGQRHVLVYNPPVINKELGIRESYLKATVKLALDLVRAGVPTLIFGHSRNNVEIILKYLRDRLAAESIDPNVVHSYRGGYLPGTRRQIESGLRAGEIRCVVATNALELGIDIGSLDAVICAGYPGSVAALWQRFGRGGRRGASSLAVLVASSAPLDQYFALKPETLTSAPVEHARIDPDNIEILIQHLKCAAFELPFEEGEAFGDVPGEAVAEALGYLTQHRVVHPATSASGKTVYHWASDAYPANHVSLRRVGWDNFVVIDLDTDATIAEMDWRSTHTMLHEQAIYQHLGEQYQVERLDFDNQKAFVRKVKPDYFTDAMTYVKVAVIEQAALTPLQGAVPATLCHGDVSVVEKVVGYKKIKFHTHENVGFGDVRLPEIEMHTTAFWLTLPMEIVDSLDISRADLVDALLGVATALHTVAAIGLMVDPRDLGKTLGDCDDQGFAAKASMQGPLFNPTVFIYDHVPGGVGLAQRLFEDGEEVLRLARALLESCRCEFGCPSCVGPVTQLQTAGDVQATTPPPARQNLSRKNLAVTILDKIGVGATN